MKSIGKISLLLVGLIFAGCSSKPTENPGSGVTVGPNSAATPAVNASTEDNSFNACSLLSAADAEQIMGAPMHLSAIKTQPTTCRYDEVTPKPNALGPAILSLTVVQSKSAEDENRAWASIKETRHLQAGEKNVQPISGIGEEAYFTGNTQKGKVGIAAVVARKRKLHFALDSQVLEYRASPDVMKSIAKRIADGLK
ncbi:MAG: hypothetical protein DMG65_13195 [Candidatus Angelobacter sp. Gp1-AA117]|nr:MAG: hypothetical protein DMG65_13195 [Candidatus Angelobacter sp. Gp1-AA117]